MLVTAAFLTRLGLLWLGTNLTPAPAGACRVELVPGDAPRAWVAAAWALRESLRDGGPADRDCRQVVIHALLDRPSVEVTTLDGRHGVRRLADARDVEPTVTALIVTVLADPARIGPAEDEATMVRAAAPVPSPSPSDSDAGGWRPQIVAGGSFRLSLPGTMAPLLELGLGAGSADWEVVLMGAWAPTTIGVGAAGTNFKSSTEFALAGARRQALGDSGVALILGARVGVIRLVGDENQQGDHLDVAGVGAAGTAFLGAVLPPLASLRLRPQLWFQWVPSARFGDTPADARLTSVGLSIGAESRFP